MRPEQRVASAQRPPPLGHGTARAPVAAPTIAIALAGASVWAIAKATMRSLDLLAAGNSVGAEAMVCLSDGDGGPVRWLAQALGTTVGGGRVSRCYACAAGNIHPMTARYWLAAAVITRA
jgi:hypothetical protein